jgi:hypothetical protein
MIVAGRTKGLFPLAEMTPNYHATYFQPSQAEGLSWRHDIQQNNIEHNALNITLRKFDTQHIGT